MKALLFTAIFFLSLTAEAQTMVMTDETTDITFATRHFGELIGTFKGAKGTANLDTNNLSASFLKLAFATSTTLHNDNLTGPNLAKAGCFNPSQYPQIELSSTSISKLPAANRYQFTGTLNVKGITKEITFPFTATPNIGGYDFNFTFPIVKKAFKLHCAVAKKFRITVRGYAKKMVSAP